LIMLGLEFFGQQPLPRILSYEVQMQVMHLQKQTLPKFLYL
jgi:hypothetical protein